MESFWCTTLCLAGRWHHYKGLTLQPLPEELGVSMEGKGSGIKTPAVQRSNMRIWDGLGLLGSGEYGNEWRVWMGDGPGDLPRLV